MPHKASEYVPAIAVCLYIEACAVMQVAPLALSTPQMHPPMHPSPCSSNSRGLRSRTSLKAAHHKLNRRWGRRQSPALTPTTTNLNCIPGSLCRSSYHQDDCIQGRCRQGSARQGSFIQGQISGLSPGRSRQATSKSWTNPGTSNLHSRHSVRSAAQRAAPQLALQLRKWAYHHITLMPLPSTEAYHSSRPSNRHSNGLLNSSSSESSSSSSSSSSRLSSRQGLLLLSLSSLPERVGLAGLLAASRTQLLAVASQEAMLQLMSPTDPCQQLSMPHSLRVLQVLRHEATARMQSERFNVKPWLFSLIGIPSAPLGISGGNKLYTIIGLRLLLSGSHRL